MTMRFHTGSANSGHSRGRYRARKQPFAFHLCFLGLLFSNIETGLIVRKNRIKYLKLWAHDFLTIDEETRWFLQTLLGMED